MSAIVPAGRQTTRIDLRSTRGVFVDFAAALDRVTRTVTWRLQAIDPETLDLPIRAGGTDVRFDLEGNARVDEADVTVLVEDILGTRRGDTNLDRAVDFGDFITFSSHFGSSVNPWAQGDFNGDGHADFSDFLQLASVFGFSAAGADFNGDKIVDATDIDLLFLAIRSGQPAIRFDLNGDAMVNQADATYLIEQLIGTRRGDANLDGNVDFADFIRLSDDFGRAGTWRDGDFDGSGFVDFGDFLILSSTFGFKRAR